MTEQFNKIPTSDLPSTYQRMHELLSGLFSTETDLIANMANFCAIIKTQFDWHWVGFYLVKKDELVLGPFQGPIACTRISKDKGVCGTSWSKRQTTIVPDVHQFPGHIACSALSNSEIVVPIFYQNEVIGVLDIDSSDFDSFSEVDAHYLEKMMTLLVEKSSHN